MTSRVQASRKSGPFLRRAPPDRVLRITSQAGWQTAMDAAGSRLLVVMFFDPSIFACGPMRVYFSRLSRHPRYGRTLFWEVDVQQCKVCVVLGVCRLGESLAAA